ncbi:MAG: flagellar basal body L-ring protein FlgH [Phycisphaerae bacterium]
MTHSTSQRILPAALAVCLLAASAGGGSIWARANRGTRNPYQDDKARAVGDVLTIVINERSTVETGTNRVMEKKDNRSSSVTGGAKFDLLRGIDAVTGKLFNLPELDVKSDNSNKFDGSAEVSTERTMVDQMTVLVEDVLPNGNLIVLGKRTREADGEKEIIQVSGVVRPSDVAYGNTIPSSRVANFHIVYHHTGRENRYTRPGWLGQVLNFVNPF